MTLPSPINHQDFLLDLDTSKLPALESELLPGVALWPLFRRRTVAVAYLYVKTSDRSAFSRNETCSS